MSRGGVRPSLYYLLLECYECGASQVASAEHDIIKEICIEHGWEYSSSHPKRDGWGALCPKCRGAA
jgi:hypothetical protein